MKNKIFLGLLIVVGFFTIALPVSAQTIFIDNFNNYIDGDLIGQGGWNPLPGYSEAVSYNVETLVVNEGQKGIAATGSSADGSLIYKSSAPVADGSMTFYFKASDSSNARGFIGLGQGTIVNFFININQTQAGKVAFYRNNSGFATLESDVVADVWHSLRIEWRSLDHKARYSLDGGVFSDYFGGFNAWNSGGLDSVMLGGNNIAGATFYFDTFQENEVIIKNPVLIVPGLTGTDLVQGERLLWADLPSMILDPTDDFMDPLKFNTNLTSFGFRIFTGDVLSKVTLNLGVGNTIIFDYAFALKKEFENQGYIENQNLFTFPYDWRYGVTGTYANGTTNVHLLKQKIDEILQQTGAQQVDIIAHSMGGLITKKYVMDNSADHHVGKAVFVGVPNTGAPESIKVLLQGDNFGVLGLNDAQMKKIAQNMPAAYDLLPTQQYYDAKGSFVKIIDEGDIGDFLVTEKNLNYQEFSSFMTSDHQLNSLALQNAQSLHTANFDNFDLRTAGVDLYAIDGCKTGTLGVINEDRFVNVVGQQFIEYKNPIFTPGDGTVPLESATNLPIDSDKKYYSLRGDHSKLMSQEGTRQQIVNLVTGGTLAVNSSLVSQDINKCKLNGKAISVFSPVDVEVTDQYGNIIGLAEDKSIINTIPNADFQIWGDHKFFYLPTDDGQVYQVSMKGTGQGSYTIKNSDIQNNHITKTQVFSNLPVTTELTGNIHFGNKEDFLTIKQTAGSDIITIFPSAVLEDIEGEDLVAPITTVTLEGDMGQPGFYRSNVKIILEATDNFAKEASGVLKISYQLDGGILQETSQSLATLDVGVEGKHTIIYFATDNMGNNELQKTIEFTIDKNSPEAVIQFNPVIMDLEFSGKDENLLSISDQDSMVIITDKAGNVTQLKLKEKNRKKRMVAQIKSLSYNGNVMDVIKNSMKFNWELDRSGKLKGLIQQVSAKKDYHIIADFGGGVTKITGKDYSGKVLKKLNELVLLKISTNKGDFNWSY